jgi:hypothetical protein
LAQTILRAPDLHGRARPSGKVPVTRRIHEDTRSEVHTTGLACGLHLRDALLAHLGPNQKGVQQQIHAMILHQAIEDQLQAFIVKGALVRG